MKKKRKAERPPIDRIVLDTGRPPRTVKVHRGATEATRALLAGSPGMDPRSASEKLPEECSDTAPQGTGRKG